MLLRCQKPHKRLLCWCVFDSSRHDLLVHSTCDKSSSTDDLLRITNTTLVRYAIPVGMHQYCCCSTWGVVEQLDKLDMSGVLTNFCCSSVHVCSSWSDLLVRSSSDGSSTDNHPMITDITNALSKLHEEQERTVSDYLTLSSELLLEAGMDPSRMDEVRLEIC